MQIRTADVADEDDEGFGPPAAAARAKPKRGKRRGIRRMPRGYKQASSRLRKKRAVLVTPEDSFGVPPPKASGGIGMSMKPAASDGADWSPSSLPAILRRAGPVRTFHYEFSAPYASAQAMFTQAVRTYDPNAIAQVLQRHPYHIDSLLQMAEFYRATTQLDASSDALRRCLFTLECAWHPMFTPWDGNCRLPHTVLANR